MYSVLQPFKNSCIYQSKIYDIQHILWQLQIDILNICWTTMQDHPSPSNFIQTNPMPHDNTINNTYTLCICKIKRMLWLSLWWIIKLLIYCSRLVYLFKYTTINSAICLYDTCNTSDNFQLLSIFFQYQ